MPTSRVFLSHAGPDSAVAQRVADYLGERGLEPILDREKLETGDKFIAFMEEALSTSDYCLLLWSEVAATRKWVKEEWHAALYRSVKENRSFLVVGRLDKHPLPALLAPRLFVQLHPDIEPGIETLVQTWGDDRQAEERSARPVASAPGLASEPGQGEGEGGGDEVYVTSKLFGVTAPCRADLDAPPGILLDRLKRQTNLPSSWDHEGRVGMRFEYHLAGEEGRLDEARALSDQGVQPRSVLWLETELKPFAAAEPEGGELAAAVFRGDEKESLERAARKHLLAAIERAGLGMRRPRRND